MTNKIKKDKKKGFNPTTLKYIVYEFEAMCRKKADIWRDVSDTISYGSVYQIINRPELYLSKENLLKVRKEVQKYRSKNEKQIKEPIQFFEEIDNWLKAWYPKVKIVASETNRNKFIEALSHFDKYIKDLK